MDESAVIFRISLDDFYGCGPDIWSDPHNKRFLVDPNQATQEARRKIYTQILDGSNVRHLAFTLNHKTKNPGCFTFGSDRNTCDVYIGSSHIAISANHFIIYFDRGQWRLHDTSSGGTIVTYSQKHRLPSSRRSLSWILFDESKQASTDIRIRLGTSLIHLDYQLFFAARTVDQVTYQHRMARFRMQAATLAEVRESLDYRMAEKSRLATALSASGHPPEGRPYYIDIAPLGSGSFGKVTKVKDASTGRVYAAKSYFDAQSDEYWLREMRILMEMKHASIPNFWTFNFRMAKEQSLMVDRIISLNSSILNSHQKYQNHA